MARKERKRIGEVLLEAGLITEDQLNQALDEASRTGTRVGSVFVSKGWITEDDLTDALSSQLRLPKVSLKTQPPDKKLFDLLPMGLVRRYQIIPYRMEDDALVVVMTDPLNVFATDALRRIVAHPIKKAIASSGEIRSWITEQYGLDSPLTAALEDAGAEPMGMVLPSTEESPDRLKRMAEETPVVRLVNALLTQASTQRASDIHIEPQEGDVRIRIRVDGVLEEAAQVPVHLKLPLTSRIKIISGMDIAEKRLPQDGRFRWTEGGGHIDVRASTLPTVYGEKMVLRLLDRGGEVFDLTNLGFDKDVVGTVRQLINRPFGVILVTGPTGSGKTTSLYAALKEINEIGRNIVTVEDPVEYEIGGLSQVQVVPSIGLSFSSVLRNILRQDPDVIMIGEIRDLETANLAVHAALTGHLVFSTLHTNDAVGAIPRLLDMGVEPYLIRSSVAGVMAQRLVRRVCTSCRTEVAPPEELVPSLEGTGSETFYVGNGCSECRETGYSGRVGIAELYQIGSVIRDLIRDDVSADTVLSVLRKQGFVTMREAGIKKAAEGITSLEEVFRATQDVDL